MTTVNNCALSQHCGPAAHRWEDPSRHARTRSRLSACVDCGCWRKQANKASACKQGTGYESHSRAWYKNNHDKHGSLRLCVTSGRAGCGFPIRTVDWLPASPNSPPTATRRNVVGAKSKTENVARRAAVGLWKAGGRREKAARWARICHRRQRSGVAHDRADQSVANNGEIHLLSEDGKWCLRATPDTGQAKRGQPVSDLEAGDSGDSGSGP
jgi:hypothetical protein